MTDKATLDKAQTAFIRARIQLLSTRPFWAHLVMRMPLRWMEGVPGGISCTDGTSMFIEPEAFLALSKEEQVSVLAHEAWHCAAGHLWRKGSRDAMRWNLAGDIYIANAMQAEGFTLLRLQEESFAKMGIYREDFAAMSTEAIYEKLPVQKQGGSGGKGKGKGQGCGHGHWNGEGCFKEAKGANKAEQQNRWRQAVIEAGQLAGNAPGAWQELVKAAMPKPPFHLRLFEYLSRGLGDDTSWDSLDRRYLWQGLYLPVSTKMVMGEIAVAVDTSGSMSTAQLTEAFGYIRAFRDQHPCKLHLIQCDYDVPDTEAGHKVYDEWDVLPEAFRVDGRGGTSFDPPFKLLREKRIEPKVLIYLTDGYGRCDEKPPAYPVLWVVLQGNARFKPPFGECVHVGSGE